MTAEVPCNFEFKQGSLKDILEELGKLYTTTGTRHKVFLQLKSDIQKYCDNKYLEAFYKDQGGGYGRGYGSGGTIQLLTDAGKRISEAILQTTPSWASQWTDPHKDHPECIQKYSEALKACLPELFSALYYLYFNCDPACSTIQGGKWHDKKVKDMRYNLGEWLTQDDSLTGLITRGYKLGELNQSKTGKDVAEQLKKAVSLTITSDSGSLQNVLCGLMFVCSWDDALTGHACAFLYKFCDEVMADREKNNQGKFTKKYPGGNFEKLIAVCTELQAKLQPFTHSSGSSCLRTVCREGTEDLFNDLWNEDKFEDYVKWLKENLPKIIASLKNMPKFSGVWTAQTLEISHTSGPFKYGFVFKDSEWQSHKGEIQKYVSPLTDESKGSLDELRKCLNGESLSYAYQSPEAIAGNTAESSSGVTAAGASVGVLSLGSAGVGAAYGFNLFGLKDIMSGVFGAIRGLIVGF